MDATNAMAHLPPDIAAALLTTAMALEIADETARCVIETECAACTARGVLDGARRWWDTGNCMAYDDPEVEQITAAEIKRAVQYLDLRDLVEHDAARPELIRFKGAAS